MLRHCPPLKRQMHPADAGAKDDVGISQADPCVRALESQTAKQADDRKQQGCRNGMSRQKPTRNSQHRNADEPSDRNGDPNAEEEDEEGSGNDSNSLHLRYRYDCRRHR